MDTADADTTRIGTYPLNEGETVLWRGEPDERPRLLRRERLLALVIAIGLPGFAVYGFVVPDSPPGWWILLCCLMIVLGVITIPVRMHVSANRRKDTHYVLTNQRAVVLRWDWIIKTYPVQEWTMLRVDREGGGLSSVLIYEYRVGRGVEYQGFDCIRDADAVATLMGSLRPDLLAK